MADQPELPYGREDPTSGFAANVTTSEAATRHRDETGKTSALQQEILRIAEVEGGKGVTALELRGWLGVHHGRVSGALSVLHKVGKLNRLEEHRQRNAIYVLPQHVYGRETRPQGRAKPKPAPAPADERLALWFDPDSIRTHFDQDGTLVAGYVETMTDEQLKEVGYRCISDDSLYHLFHRLLSANVIYVHAKSAQ